MDEQRAGRDLHRYRSRIAALTKALEDVRDVLLPAMYAEDRNAIKAVGIIDKALARATESLNSRDG